MLNAYWEPLAFELPTLPTGIDWYRIVDTARASPEDFRWPDEAPRVGRGRYPLEARSAVMLLAK
jgi:glycogen operon protein